jgi:hypothetical protein
MYGQKRDGPEKGPSRFSSLFTRDRVRRRGTVLTTRTQTAWPPRRSIHHRSLAPGLAGEVLTQTGLQPASIQRSPYVAAAAPPSGSAPARSHAEAAGEARETRTVTAARETAAPTPGTESTTRVPEVRTPGTAVKAHAPAASTPGTGLAPLGPAKKPRWTAPSSLRAGVTRSPNVTGHHPHHHRGVGLRPHPVGNYR